MSMVRGLKPAFGVQHYRNEVEAGMTEQTLSIPAHRDSTFALVAVVLFRRGRWKVRAV